MRVALLSGVMLLSGFGTASATSEDLIFCSKLSSARERVACYDAAARIAANQARSPVRTRGPATPYAPPASQHLAKADVHHPPPSRFSGYYAAVGASFGHSGSFGPSLTTGGYTQLGGASGVIALGYNAMFDAWLLGLEVNGRFGDEGGRMLVQRPFPATGYDPLKITSDASMHLSGRVGRAFGDHLIFSKIGIGASHTREVFMGGPAAAAWTPSILLSLGYERNWNAFFARFAAELEAVSRPNVVSTPPFGTPVTAPSDWAWTARAAAMVGARF